MKNLDMLLKLIWGDCDGNGTKNVCQVLIFGLPTVSKLQSLLNTRGDSGARGRGWQKDSKVRKRHLPIPICVGYSWFCLYILKFFITLVNGKER